MITMHRLSQSFTALSCRISVRFRSAPNHSYSGDTAVSYGCLQGMELCQQLQDGSVGKEEEQLKKTEEKCDFKMNHPARKLIMKRK